MEKTQIERRCAASGSSNGAPANVTISAAPNTTGNASEKLLMRGTSRPIAPDAQCTIAATAIAGPATARATRASASGNAIANARRATASSGAPAGTRANDVPYAASTGPYAPARK